MAHYVSQPVHSEVLGVRRIGHLSNEGASTMTDDTTAVLELSRRRALSALGVAGVASAGAGLGTSAYFSDQETYEGNQLVAGSLDLKVDWEEHYSDWSQDEFEGLENPVLTSNDEIPDTYIGVPFCSENPTLYIHQADLLTFMANTSIEAMPDTNNDGSQDPIDVDVCSQPWDVPEILDPAGPRTDDDATEDTTLREDGTPAPLVYLEDIKPGDFGELTLSFHLCDNDGYVWLTGELVENAENGLTEPEAADPDENGGEPGELPGAIQTCVWYDENCDNTFLDRETEVMLATDLSESIDSSELPGTPAGVDGDTGDATILEAVRAAIGDYDGPGFLSQLNEQCSQDVTIGAMSFSENLEHQDNDNDGDDGPPPGNDAEGQDAALDKALMPVGADNQTFPTDDNPNAGTDNGGATEYEELKQLFGGGTDFSDENEFVIDDRSDGTPFNGARYDPTISGNDDYTLGNGNDTFVAERPYTGDGDSTPDDGLVKAIQALLPEGETYEWQERPGVTVDEPIRGIDPSGNASEPGAARKKLVYIEDGSYSGVGEDDPEPIFDPGNIEESARSVRENAENLGIDIQPILVNEDPSANDVLFAEILATTAEQPLFVNHYDDPTATCPDAVANAGYDCTSMVDAMESVRNQICAGGGDEEVIFQGSLGALLDRLSQGVGLPLDGDPTTPFDEVTGDPTDPNRECFVGSSTYCLGIEWWLPVDHGNEVQSDSAAFDLGFYTEQCRHNNGAGLPPEEGQSVNNSTTDTSANNSTS